MRVLNTFLKHLLSSNNFETNKRKRKEREKKQTNKELNKLKESYCDASAKYSQHSVIPISTVFVSL